MIRKSRKRLADTKPTKLKKPYDFVAGGYLRVSENDKQSIENQKNIIQSYVDKDSDIILTKYYIDDGKSSFITSRPAFCELITDIESGAINCVIVKDISRFGRDDLEVAAYIQRTFPIHGARFISITDKYDSLEDSGNQNLSFLLKNLINYAYSKDISNKVRSVVKLRQEQGDYIGAALPYGYKKRKVNGITEYAIDEYPAGVVRNIFLWALQGDTGYTIASRLNTRGVVSPGDYRKQIADASVQHGIWTRRMVMDILRNRVYTGTHVMGKTWTPSWQMRKPKRVEENNWILVQGHHDQIVEQELFQNVQQVLNSRCKQAFTKKHDQNENDYLGRKLFCGDCGRKMKRRNVRGSVYYICPRYMEAKNACTAKWTRQTVLMSDVFDAIQMEIETIREYHSKQVEYEQSLAFKMKHDYLQKQSVRVADEIEFLKSREMRRYEIMFEGIISGSDYLLIRKYVDAELDLAKKKLYTIQAELAHYNDYVSSSSKRVKAFLKFADVNELSEDMYNVLVERALIKDTGIEVIMRFM